MHARYYSGYMGRFLSLDPVRSGRPANPQSWNRYAYVFNNPLKWVDPNGECAATPGLTEGFVGICIEGFIGRKRIGGVGLGDNRGFERNDPEATARVSLNMIVDPRQGGVTGGGVTKGFPSIAGYAYEIVQGETVIEVLFERPEGDPGELNGPMDKPLTRE